MGISLRAFGLLACSLALAGCPGSSAPIDDTGTAPRDASVDGPADASGLDATALDDGGQPLDGDSLDGGDPTDGGGPTDAGVGTADDAGTGSDGGTGSDAGNDGGLRTDAGPDGGGSDAGPVTTCIVVATPPSVTTAESITFTSTSNGTGCTARIGAASMSVGCNASMTLPGSFFGVGTYTIELLVADGPAGPTTCSDTFTVTAVAPTTCAIDVTPDSGLPSDAFTIDAASNGSGCWIRLDGGSPTAAPCTFTLAQPGTMFGVGAHTLELLVDAGPGGPTMCSTTFSVSATPTTCSMVVTPESGTSATTFTAVWTSNGSTCTVSIDGFSLGTQPCTAMTSAPGSMVGPGTHTVRLDVAGGPGGPTSCSDTLFVSP